MKRLFVVFSLIFITVSLLALSANAQGPCPTDADLTIGPPTLHPHSSVYAVDVTVTWTPSSNAKKFLTLTDYDQSVTFDISKSEAGSDGKASQSYTLFYTAPQQASIGYMLRATISHGGNEKNICWTDAGIITLWPTAATGPF